MRKIIFTVLLFSINLFAGYRGSSWNLRYKEYHVKDFCDTTDTAIEQTLGFQECLDLALANEGTMIIDPGNWTVTPGDNYEYTEGSPKFEIFKIDGDVSIIGYGPQYSSITCTSDTLYHLFWVTEDVEDRAYFEGFSVYGPTEENNGSPLDGAYTNHFPRCFLLNHYPDIVSDNEIVFYNMWIRGFDTAIREERGSNYNIMVDNCKIWDTGAVCFYAGGGYGSIEVRNSIFYNVGLPDTLHPAGAIVGGHILYFTSNELKVNVDGNFFGFDPQDSLAATTNTDLEGIAYHNNASIPQSSDQRFSFTNNIVKGTGGLSGGVITGTNFVQISNNKFIGLRQYAIRFRDNASYKSVMMLDNNGFINCVYDIDHTDANSLSNLESIIIINNSYHTSNDTSHIVISDLETNIGEYIINNMYVDYTGSDSIGNMIVMGLAEADTLLRATFNNCVFKNRLCKEGTGLIVLYRGKFTFNNCTFDSVGSYSVSGAAPTIWSRLYSGLTLNNCDFNLINGSKISIVNTTGSEYYGMNNTIKSDGSAFPTTDPIAVDNPQLARFKRKERAYTDTLSIAVDKLYTGYNYDTFKVESSDKTIANIYPTPNHMAGALYLIPADSLAFSAGGNIVPLNTNFIHSDTMRVFIPDPQANKWRELYNPRP